MQDQTKCKKFGSMNYKSNKSKRECVMHKTAIRRQEGRGINI